MRNVMLTTSLVALTAGGLLAQPAAAQENDAALGEGDIVALDTWSYDPLYADAWSIEQMMDDATVVGDGGDEIGTVENVIVDENSRILGIIAQVGGFWDVGDTHVSIPWDQVERQNGEVRVPVTEETVDEYSVFGEPSFFPEEAAEEVTRVDDDLATATGVFKATDVIGDYAYLSGGERYGYVTDLLVQDGEVTTVVVDAGAYGAPGYYAYPYAGPGYGPMYGRGYGRYDYRYTMPYTPEDVTVIDTFDYGQMRYHLGSVADDET